MHSKNNIGIMNNTRHFGLDDETDQRYRLNPSNKIKGGGRHQNMMTDFHSLPGVFEDKYLHEVL